MCTNSAGQAKVFHHTVRDYCKISLLSIYNSLYFMECIPLCLKEAIWVPQHLIISSLRQFVYKFIIFTPMTALNEVKKYVWDNPLVFLLVSGVYCRTGIPLKTIKQRNSILLVSRKSCKRKLSFIVFFK